MFVLHLEGYGDTRETGLWLRWLQFPDVSRSGKADSLCNSHLAAAASGSRHPDLPTEPSLGGSGEGAWRWGFLPGR